MKKKFIFSLILSSIMLSCKKEVNGINNIENSHNQARTFDLEIIANPDPIDPNAVLNKSGKTEEEMFDDKLMEIALLSRNLLKNGSYNQYLIEKAKSRESNSVRLSEFCDDNESNALNSEKEKFSNIQSYIHSNSLNHQSQNPANLGEIENYVHTFFIPNADIADFTKEPVISSGKEVNSNNPKLSQYEDYIIGWIKNEDGSFQEIILNEEMAMNTSHPIIIVDNGQDNSISRSKIQTGNIAPDNSKASEKEPEIHSFENQINHRYDNTPNSEFCITAVGFSDVDAVLYTPFRMPNGTTKNWKKINDINKKDINKLQYKWVHLFGSNYGYTVNSGLKIYWNTFERDWYRSPKDIGSVVSGGSTYYLAGNMHYSSDWYAFSPSSVQSNMLNVSHILSNWAIWSDVTKSKLRFWKVI